MKNIEKIIKYLSGEMLPDESKKFMQEVTGDVDFRSEFESVSLIWKELKNQLTLKDGPESTDREAFITEVLAEHDLQFYKQEPESKKELEFRKKLERVMNEIPESETKKRRFNPRILSMISMAAAAAIIAFVVILNPPPDLYELTGQYYQPSSDEVFESISSTSRSGVGSAMTFFKQGDFEKAQSLSFSEMQKYPDIGELRLLYALSCYELGDQKAAEANLNAITQRHEGGIDETARWYLALIQISVDMEQEANLILKDLIAAESSYQKQAQKLLRKIEKQED